MKMILGLMATLAFTSSLAADEFEAALHEFLDEHVVQWASDPVLVKAIGAQNVVTTSYDQATIDQMDALWRAQVGMDGATIIEDVLSNAAANFLRQQVNSADGAITDGIRHGCEGAERRRIACDIRLLAG